MIEIDPIFNLLNNQEQQSFLTYLAKRNKRADTKNVELYKDILDGQPERLKGVIGTNAYHVLKKRLMDRLTDFTASSIVANEKTDETEIFKWIILGRKLFDQKEFKAAIRIILKAEKKAEHIKSYHLLNEIYQTLIEHSYHELSPNQDELFRKYSKNQQIFQNQANLNMAYAVIRKTFHEQERQAVPIDINKVIAHNFEKFGISNADGYNFQSLFQIAEMANIYGALSRNYYGIDLFFEHQVELLQGGPLDIESQLNYHTDLLYLIAHIYFRKKSFDKSLLYLVKMNEQMVRYDKKYFDLWKVKHQTLTALNHNYLGNHEKAALLLDDLLTKRIARKAKDRDILQTSLARIMIHFQQEEFKDARQKLAQLKRSDKWYIDNIGLEWLLNKKFMDILLHIELGNTDFVDSRINSLLRQQKVLFVGANSQALPFLKLVKAYHQNPAAVREKEFENKINKTFDWKPLEQEDLFLMSFYAWLKAKMKAAPLYETTLKLVQSK